MSSAVLRTLLLRARVFYLSDEHKDRILKLTRNSDIPGLRRVRKKLVLILGLKDNLGLGEGSSIEKALRQELWS